MWIQRLSKPRKVPFWLQALGLYTMALFVYLILPLGAGWGHSLLGATPDPIKSAAILEWGDRVLWSRPGQVFDWPAAYPLENSLATAENLFGWQIFYAPFRSLGAGISAAYNITLVASFLVAGLGASLFARHIGANIAGALVAGLIFAFAPFHLTHLVHLSTMSVCWSPLAFLFLDRFLTSRSKWDAVGLAAMYLLTVLCGLYFGVYLLFFLAVYLFLTCGLGRHRLDVRSLWPLGVAGVCTVALLLPVVIPYVKVSNGVGLGRSMDQVVAQSIPLTDFFLIPSWVIAWSSTWFVSDRPTAAFPGLTPLLLVAVLLLSHRARTEWGRTASILTILCLAAIVLSLGPYLKVEGGFPMLIRGHLVPLPGRVFLVSALRAPMRALFYGYLFGGVLAGLGVTALCARFATRFRVGLGLLFVALVFAEYIPKPSYAANSMMLPEMLTASDAYPFLAREEDRGAIVELPLPERTSSLHLQRQRYIFATLGHGRRVAVYHDGWKAPDSVNRLQEAAAQLPSDVARQLLVQAGVTRLVVHRSLLGEKQSQEVLAALDGAGYTRAFTGIEGVVYALGPDAGKPADGHAEKGTASR